VNKYLIKLLKGRKFSFGSPFQCFNPWSLAPCTWEEHHERMWHRRAVHMTEKKKWGNGAQEKVQSPSTCPPLAFFLHQVPKSRVPKTSKVALLPVAIETCEPVVIILY
jgi:hypothetical protein